MKYVYILEKRQQNNNGEFIVYNHEAFSSMKKAEAAIENIVDCNNGYNRSEGFNYKEIGLVRSLDYSSNANSEGVHMRLRLCILKLEVR